MQKVLTKKEDPPSQTQRYPILLLTLGSAVAVQFWLTRVLDANTPFVSYSGTVVVASWCAGLVGGLLAATVVVFRDVTDRKRAEQELRAGDARYRSLIRATSQIVWTATRDGKVVEDSPTWRKHTGQRLEEMQGSGWIDAIHPEDREQALKVWNRAVESDVHEAESRVRAADGSYGDFRVCGVPVLEPDGSVREWIWTYTDITRDKRAEQALRVARDELEARVAERTAAVEEANRSLQTEIDERRHAETKSETFFNLSQDMLGVAGFDGYFTSMNPAWEMTLGYSRKALMAQPFLDFVHPADREKTTAEMRKLRTGASTVLFENRYRCRDGSYRWLLWNATPLTGRSEIYASARDITQRRREEKELELARDTAEAANHAKDQFLANVSHEIRTPLNGILGMTGLALQTSLTVEQREYLSLAQESSQSLVTVIDDILDLSRLEADRLRLDPIDFDLRDSVEDAVRSFALRASEKGLHLAVRVAPEVPAILHGDPSRLRQILVNLIGNAVKFTASGEILVRVFPEAGADDDVMVRFSVADTGIGVPAEKREAIFDPFVQADGSTSRQYGGTGLGLAIAKGLVEMMGGRIWVESEVGKGSKFAFTARFARVAESADPKRPARRHEPLRDMEVLVVEDNAMSRRILEEALLSWWMHPRVVSSGGEALDEMTRAATEGRPFRLVLLDAQMPDQDGFSVAEEIRRRPELSGAAILMLSSAGLNGDADRCEELGIAGYLTKPVKKSDLLDAVLALLGAPAGDSPPPLVTRLSLSRARRSLRILLAEDNRVSQTLAVRLLEKHGHTVVAANNGREALEALDKEAFDLFLTDVQMPELDGLQTTAAIRKREKTSGGHLPVIAMTAHAMAGDRERFLEAGMDAYISKPFEPDALFEVIRSVVDDAAAPALSGPLPPSEELVELDRASLLTQVGGDFELLEDMVGIFREDCPQWIERVHDALRRRDGEELGLAVHGLKGAVGNFRAAGALETTKRLELEGHRGDFVAAGETLHALERKLELLQSALSSLLQEAHA